MTTNLMSYALLREEVLTQDFVNSLSCIQSPLSLILQSYSEYYVFSFLYLRDTPIYPKEWEGTYFTWSVRYPFWETVSSPIYPSVA